MSVNTTKWVLVAEDDVDVRESICELLDSRFGKEIKIIKSPDGADGISKINNQTFHLIIADLNMPKRGGGELVEAARSNDFNETTPAIVISGTSTNKVENDYKFVTFIPKPLDPDNFVQAIRNIFSIGSTEKMISASIFNGLLESSQAFLEEALKRKNFKAGKMEFKKKGEELKADHAAIITVYVGKVSNTFSVLCNRETLEALRDGSEKISGTSLDVICRSLGFVILKSVLTRCGIIDSNIVKTKDITQDPTLLINKQGIVVPIIAENLSFKIFATTKGGD